MALLASAAPAAITERLSMRLISLSPVVSTVGFLWRSVLRRVTGEKAGAGKPDGQDFVVFVRRDFIPVQRGDEPQEGALLVPHEAWRSDRNAAAHFATTSNGLPFSAK
jgi:hypothetical protein